mgnify:CR=1 FL=1
MVIFPKLAPDPVVEFMVIVENNVVEDGTDIKEEVEQQILE